MRALDQGHEVLALILYWQRGESSLPPPASTAVERAIGCARGAAESWAMAPLAGNVKLSQKNTDFDPVGLEFSGGRGDEDPSEGMPGAFSPLEKGGKGIPGALHQWKVARDFGILSNLLSQQLRIAIYMSASYVHAL